ncbi:PepSY domain-containing protein [Roseivirga sp. UBA838]|uniref:PepSY domain-containing protein n=1 Tax=Roseivirga sp. UBA838 TaxID=1947393 RepID=UPI0025800C9C|nr:PepSY domain-containing protein [Roseivirga sp. UBA838]|tara:strand:- start:7362 stop:9410 length:2049 start_codon:yes stop_codon:yes gene_type:complete
MTDSGKRNYHVFFHLHTVSGIVISTALFIIFFCGAFALIKDEITAWEKGKRVFQEEALNIDYDRAIDSIKVADYDLYGRDLRILVPDAKQEIYFQLSESQDSTITFKDDQAYYFYVDAHEYTLSAYYAFYSIGELIYRLHFFSQIPYVGIYLAGFVAFFFLLAIVSGVIIHWKKIVSNFYLFRPLAKVKTVWTDAHTALGVIGLPFQFVFALTSCFLCMSIFVLAPANLMYKGNQSQMMEEVRPMMKAYTLGNPAQSIGSLNGLMEEVQNRWEGFRPVQVYIRNYGADNMIFQVDGMVMNQKKFVAHGRAVYDVASRELIAQKLPDEWNYLEGVETVVRALHFGDWGGYTLKIVYFILALITCFVIISGVLIWLTAREKKSISPSQRLFNRKVGHVFIAICMSIYPVTAFAMIVARLIPREMDASRQSILYLAFFVIGLFVVLFFRFKRNNHFTTRYSLLAGAVLGLLIPLVNGMVSGNWFWTMLAENQIEIALVDMVWISLSATALFTLNKLKKPEPLVPSHEELLAMQKEEFINELTALPKTEKTMKYKIAILWLASAIGFILHGMYGLYGVYYHESLMMEDATGEVPLAHHLWRVGLEGMAFLLSVLCLELRARWFYWTAFTWAILHGLFNVYHLATALMYEPSNLSEILALAVMVVISVFLIKAFREWNKELIVNPKE